MPRTSTKSSLPGRGYGRTVELFNLLAAYPDGFTATELATRLNMPKSTLLLMVRHFRESRLLSLNSERHICVGPALVWLAFRILDGLTVRRLARPYLEALARKTGENVYLAALSNLDLILLDNFEGANVVRLNVELGGLRPLHATAAGKALLAFSDRQLLRDYATTRGLSRFTDRTITSATAMDKELVRILRAGYAESDEETFEGICSFAVPLMNDGKPTAAISVLALRTRAFDRRDSLVAELKRCKDAIERAMAAAMAGPAPQCRATRRE